VITAIHRQSKPVLIHCSDGWDRTPQILALSKLLLDPYYRTIRGFRTLVEVDWLMFGHKFAQRNGHAVNHTDVNERCPVFLQWLDCVYQITRQFPWAFEFNENFLLKLCYHSYSCLFGTFLCDSTQERINEHTADRTISVWSLLNENNSQIINYLYDEKFDEVIYPNAELVHMQLWYKLFCEPELIYLTDMNRQEVFSFNDSFNANSASASVEQNSSLNIAQTFNDEDLELEEQLSKLKLADPPSALSLITYPQKSIQDLKWTILSDRKVNHLYKASSFEAISCCLNNYPTNREIQEQNASNSNRNKGHLLNRCFCDSHFHGKRANSKSNQNQKSSSQSINGRILRKINSESSLAYYASSLLLGFNLASIKNSSKNGDTAAGAIVNGKCSTKIENESEKISINKDIVSFKNITANDQANSSRMIK
jgi:hypothetical protein